MYGTTTAYSLTPYTFSIVGGTQATSDVVYHLDDITVSNINSNSHIEVSEDLTWSISGSTTINYSYSSDKGNSIPGWASVDSTNFKLIFDTLPVTSDTSYAFTLAVSTSSDSTLYYSSVFVNVKYVPAVWAVINWSSWSNIDGTFWIQWNSGYQLSADNHSWNLIPTNTASSTPPTTSSISETSSKSKLGVIVSLAGAGISTAIIGALSIMNYSSPQGIWMVINHFQLLVLLLLTEAYFPADISSFFAGAKLFNFSFNFIPVVELNIFNKFFNLFDFSIEIGYLDTIGLITASVLINWLNFVFSFLIWITFHILFVLAHKWTKSYSKESKTYRNVINYGYRFFTLWIYIRLILEIYQYLLIWSISEISIFNLSSTYRKISLVFAFLTFVFWLTMKFNEG